MTRKILKNLHGHYAVFLILSCLTLILTACEQLETNLKTTAIEFEDKAVGKVVPSQNANQLRLQGDDIVFVSVREKAEWDEQHIPGAIWIPHSRLKEQDEFSWKLLKNLSETHKYVITYCGAGHRSGFVAAQVR